MVALQKIMQFNSVIDSEAYGTKYSRMDQLKFVEDNPYKIWRDMAVFHKFYLVHSWILCSMFRTLSNIFYGACFAKITDLKTFNHYHKKLHHRCNNSSAICRRFVWVSLTTLCGCSLNGLVVLLLNDVGKDGWSFLYSNLLNAQEILKDLWIFKIFKS